jgi:hypothetical protein
MTDRALLLGFRRELRRVADPVKAPQMRAYMKSEMPYNGVPAPAARKAFQAVLGGLELSESQSWRRTILYIWRGARFREERYAAIALSLHRRFAEYQTLDSLPMYICACERCTTQSAQPA